MDKNLLNFANTKISSTTAVGGFPNSASCYGAEEMLGNVWEWTRSLYKGYPYKPDDGREEQENSYAHVRRGGSFNFSRSYCRCAYRSDYFPNSRRHDVGFRIVVLPFGDGTLPHP